MKYRDLAKAFEVGVAVVRAKKPEDIQEVGLHICDPTIGQVLEAVISAMRHGCNLVYIHSKETWWTTPKDDQR